MTNGNFEDEEMSSSFNSSNGEDPDEDEIFQNFETDNDSEFKDQMAHVTMEETSKRHRNRT